MSVEVDPAEEIEERCEILGEVTTIYFQNPKFNSATTPPSVSGLPSFSNRCRAVPMSLRASLDKIVCGSSYQDCPEAVGKWRSCAFMALRMTTSRIDRDSKKAPEIAIFHSYNTNVGGSRPSATRKYGSKRSVERNRRTLSQRSRSFRTKLPHVSLKLEDPGRPL